jgi:hypothetical protein
MCKHTVVIYSMFIFLSRIWLLTIIIIIQLDSSVIIFRKDIYFLELSIHALLFQWKTFLLLRICCELIFLISATFLFVLQLWPAFIITRKLFFHNTKPKPVDFLRWYNPFQWSWQSYWVHEIKCVCNFSADVSNKMRKEEQQECLIVDQPISCGYRTVYQLLWGY